MSPRLCLGIVSAAVFAGAALAVPSVGAAAEGPRWTVTAVSRPTNFQPDDESGDDSYRVTVTNTGGSSSDGSPVVITDDLPVGQNEAPLLSMASPGASGEDPLEGDSGAPTQGSFSCVFRTCVYEGVVVPDQTIDATFPVDVSPEAQPTVTNVVQVTGGGAPEASVSTPTTISSEPASFGVSPGGAVTALSTLQAGAHPDLTASIAFNTVRASGSLAGDPKNTMFELPPGFAGDLRDTPSCALGSFGLGECSPSTQIGIATIAVWQEGHAAVQYVEPVYNLSPNMGDLAKLGFSVGEAIHVQGNVTLLSDYGLRTTFENIVANEDELDDVSLTLWGVPSSHVHDPLRRGRNGSFGAASEATPIPFFTAPTVCSSESLQARLTVNSWQQPAQFVEQEMSFGPFAGCDRLEMEPSLTAEASTERAYSPTGLDLSTSVPQTYESAEGLAASTLKTEAVTLPEGMTINPSSGAGLSACSEEQYAEEAATGKTAAERAEGRGCPDSSKLATVSVVTPSLGEEATGFIYLASPAPRHEEGRNPFDSLLALYLVVRIPNRGVLIKSAGRVDANEVTGQLTTTFNELPPLPFSLATIRFSQGEDAPLVTPATCGSFTIVAELTPWSDPDGSPLDPTIAPLPITANCPASGMPPFDPELVAGTDSNAAGGYAPTYMRISRNDGEQEITGISAQLPPGLSGNLTGIEECTEADIQRARAQTGAQAETEPACSATTEIGHSVAEVGVGSVLAQAPGKLYLGEPYEGAPFSVVSITSAHVGPFDLGTVVVRLPLNIDSLTAQVTIGPGPADQIPHIIKGIVVHLRTIRVYVDRHDFTFNPTSCEPMLLSATVFGSGTNASSPESIPVTVSDRFQDADCQNLKFEPKFTVSTSARTSRADGASLTVKLTYPRDALGADANIRKVKVELPRQLPSRLTTLQKACTAAQFRADRAACPPGSMVGHAKALTPILPVPLEGPAYFVSNGSEAFPNLIMVLQGDGVTIDLVGATYINKSTGITSSTFNTVPDQPVESFELSLPEGPHSALAAYGSLCKPVRTTTVKTTVMVDKHKVTRHVKKTVATSLSMPSEFVSQSGVVLRKDTQVGVQGCPRAKK